MIRIHKEFPPAKLDDGVVRSRNDCAAYNKYGDDYRTPHTKTFKFAREIYGDSTVKNALKRSQHNKCCYCEGKFQANAFGDVEHYRPKGAIRQDINSKKLHPGYFWLAYTWKNLYWCCEVCNRSYKNDLFPLRNDERRARSPVDNLEDEEPLILDPGDDSIDPRDHIKFHDELATSNTKFGTTTIKVVGLNRPALQEERLTHLNEVRRLFDTICILKNSETIQPDQISNYIDDLENRAKLTEKFSAMTNDFLQSHGWRHHKRYRVRSRPGSVRQDAEARSAT